MRRLRIWILGPLALLSSLAASAALIESSSGSLTLSVSSTRETCTLGSVTTLVYDIQGGQPPYRLTVDGRTVEQSAEPQYIPCRRSAIWSPLESVGDDSIQRISVSVNDAAGVRAYAVAKVQLVPPLPAPRALTVTSGVDGQSTVHLTAEWWIQYLPREQRTGDAAIRWRVKGSDEWNVQHHQGEQTYGFRYRASWTVDAPLTGERREVQLAQIRHVHDLLAPLALRWSALTAVTTAAPPHELQAEATHERITLQWGPHPPGLVYVANLGAVEGDWYEHRKQLRLESGQLVEARFDDLLPDTLYRVEVYLNDGNWSLLDQNRFVLQTEAAPAGWSPPSRAPTNVSAVATEGAMEVTWTPAETGARHDTMVCAYPTEKWWKEACVRVASGQSRARLSLAELGDGGTFQVGVETLTTPPGSAQASLHVPTYRPNLPVRPASATAPRFADVTWNGPTRDTSAEGAWSFNWVQGDARLAEVSWRQQGGAIIRESRTGWFSVNLPAGHAPEDVRVRLLNDDGWTEWSDPADVPSVTAPMSPPSLRVNARENQLEVRWSAASDDSDVIGYRLYIARNSSGAEVIDVGKQTSAASPVRSDDRNFSVSVAPLTSVFGVLAPSWDSYYSLDRIGFDLYGGSTPCHSVASTRMMVSWSVSGGTPPFLVSIGNQLAFRTDEYFGRTELECLATEDGTALKILGSVTDARGLTASDNYWLSATRSPSADSELEQIPINLGPRSVHRDHVLLSWDCHYRPYTAVLRWRHTGRDDWTYAADFPQHREPRDDYRRCRGSLDGLEPLTTYEYQLAKAVHIGEIPNPGQISWSDTQVVTTLGPPQHLVIAQDAETVDVSWQRQPEAWAYLVGLRAEGRSWWKPYEPNGKSVETVSFDRVPEDVEVSIELISPPLEGGIESRREGYDAFWIAAE